MIFLPHYLRRSTMPKKLLSVNLAVAYNETQVGKMKEMEMPIATEQ